MFFIIIFNITYLTLFFPSHFSTNHLEACAALSAVCKVVNADMIPAIIKDVSYLPFLMFPHVSSCVMIFGLSFGRVTERDEDMNEVKERISQIA